MQNTPSPEPDYSDVNAVNLVKDSGNRYLYYFRDDQREEVTQAILRHAENPELDITMADYQRLAQKILGV